MANATLTYVVPAGFVAVLRDLDVIQVSSGTNGLVIVQDSGFITWLTLATNNIWAHVQWTGRQVFTAGQSLDLISSGHTFHMRASGYLLTA